MPQLFGRTNEPFPAVWLSPRLPSDSADIEPLGAALSKSSTVIDVSGQPALWGSFLRRTTQPVMAIGLEDVSRANSERHAADLVEAHLFQTLSAIGRETLDFYFLPIRKAWDEFQLSGVFSALEAARQEGHVRFIGIAATGSPLAALGALLVTDQTAYDQLNPVAKERRVGILGKDMDVETRLITVTSAEQVATELEVAAL